MPQGRYWIVPSGHATWWRWKKLGEKIFGESLVVWVTSSPVGEGSGCIWVVHIHAVIYMREATKSPPGNLTPDPWSWGCMCADTDTQLRRLKGRTMYFHWLQGKDAWVFLWSKWSHWDWGQGKGGQTPPGANLKVVWPRGLAGGLWNPNRESLECTAKCSGD